MKTKGERMTDVYNQYYKETQKISGEYERLLKLAREEYNRKLLEIENGK